MRTVVVMAVYLISFFPNPFHNWHWPWHKCPTYSIGSVSVQEAPDFLHDGSALLFDPEGNQCLMDKNVWYFIGNDGSIGWSNKSCTDAVRHGTELSSPVHTYSYAPVERLIS